MSLKNKRVLITGGATGIGRATAILCAKSGASVVIADVNATDAEAVVSNISKDGGKAWFVQTDVSDESNIVSLVLDAEKHMGGIDVLVSAAGIATDSLISVEDVLTESWDRLIDINLKGSFLAAKHTVPVMKKSGGGVIVMIASGAGVKGPSSSVPYGASKGGVNGLAMTLEPQLARENIRVNVLCPGNISTPLKLGIIDDQVEKIGESARRDDQISGLGTPEGMAKIIRFMISEDADYLRGAIFTR